MSKAGCQAGAVVVASLVKMSGHRTGPSVLTEKQRVQNSREAARSHRLQRRAVGRWRGAIGAPAMAAGFWIYEMGTPDLGTASAGRAASAKDAATVFGNPAGMTSLDRSQLLVGTQLIVGDVHFNRGSGTTVAGGNGGNASGAIPGASFYYAHSVTPDFKLGFWNGSYMGGALQYEDNWSGRYYVQKIEWLTLGAGINGAYKVNDWLSIGGGPFALYSDLEQRVALNNLLARPGRQTEVRGRRVRVRRHGRADARTHRGHPGRRDLYLAGQARLQGPPVHQESRSGVSVAEGQSGALHAPARPRAHGAAGRSWRAPTMSSTTAWRSWATWCGRTGASSANPTSRWPTPTSATRRSTSTTTTPGASRSGRSTRSRTAGCGRSAAATTPPRCQRG